MQKQLMSGKEEKMSWANNVELMEKYFAKKSFSIYSFSSALLKFL
jgi:hypothetical protein